MRTLLLLTSISALLVACSSSPSSLDLGEDDPGANGDAPGDDGNGGGPGGTAPACTDVGQTYQGFAGTELTTGRVDGAMGADRGRIKPFSALTGEYPRVLGAPPATLAQTGATFGQPQPRWYVEPQASAVSLYTAYAVAFDGCLTFTASDAQYANAPDAASAKAACTSLARTFWSRTPSPAEIDACVDVATVQSAKETNARRRWAYTCAAVLSSAGFLAY